MESRRFGGAARSLRLPFPVAVGVVLLGAMAASLVWAIVTPWPGLILPFTVGLLSVCVAAVMMVVTDKPERVIPSPFIGQVRSDGEWVDATRRDSLFDAVDWYASDRDARRVIDGDGHVIIGGAT